MAVSWQRLIDGHDIKDMDIVLLHYELIELTLMADGLKYDEAHEQAEMKYSYTKYTKALDEMEGVS